MVRCVRDNPDYYDSFRALNYQWMLPLLGVEEADRLILDNPGAVVSHGGHILTLLLADRPMGCCALLARGPGRFELAKMAVDPDYQGRGYSHHLMRAAIQAARERGASHLELRTNAKLTAAIALYERHGFCRANADLSTSRCDVTMVLALDELHPEYSGKR